MSGCSRQPLLLLLQLLQLLAAAVQASSSRGRPPSDLQRLEGRALVFTVDRRHGRSERLLAVDMPSGERVNIDINGADARLRAALHRLRTGVRVQVSGQWVAPPPGGTRAGAAKAASSRRTSTPSRSFRAAALAFTSSSMLAGAATAARGSAAAAAATPDLSFNTPITAELRTIIVPVAGVDPATGSYCDPTSAPKLSAAEVAQVVFSEVSPPPAVTVSSTYSECSHGKMQLSMDHSMVADLVELPCTGADSTSSLWKANNCQLDDYGSYADAADAVLKRRGIDLSSYPYRVYLLPPGACDFTGMALLGCTVSDGCRSWIGGEDWGEHQAYVHEIAHNLFLEHAGSTNNQGVYDEYADESCAMGSCCSDRCFNTPHAWQLGWLPVQQLDRNSLWPGRTLRFMLPPQSSVNATGLRIVPDWIRARSTVRDPLFIGYRTQAGGDRYIPNTVKNRVLVYSSAVSGAYDTASTNRLASLSSLKRYVYAGTGIVVRTLKLTEAGAELTVCRLAGRETLASCRAGLDYDCNGLAGGKDAACQKLLAEARAKKRLKTTH